MISWSSDEDGVTFVLPSVSGVPERVYFPRKAEYYRMHCIGFPKGECLEVDQGGHCTGGSLARGVEVGQGADGRGQDLSDLVVEHG